MDEHTPPGPETDVISGYYDDYKQTQAEIFQRESKRARNSILTVAILLFASDMLGLAIANLITGQTIAYALLFPAIFTAMAFLAIKQPMLAVIIAIIVFAGIIIVSVLAYGGRGAISSIIVKAIIVYFLLAAFQSAKVAERARKEMQG
jgi:hypothetical protein